MRLEDLEAAGQGRAMFVCPPAVNFGDVCKFITLERQLAAATSSALTASRDATRREQAAELSPKGADAQGQ